MSVLSAIKKAVVREPVRKSIDHLQLCIFLRPCHGRHVGVHKCIAVIKEKAFFYVAACAQTQVAILAKFANFNIKHKS